jgi:hypothetical protein
MKVASVYMCPAISIPFDRPGKMESGPVTDSLTGFIHYKKAVGIKVKK